MGVNPRQFPLISILKTAILLQLWVCCPHVTSGQVAEVPVEAKVEPARTDPKSITPRTLESRVIPKRVYAGATPSLKFPLVPHRHNRTLVSMNQGYRSELIHKTMVEMRSRFPEGMELHLWDEKSAIPGFKERIRIASHQEIGIGRTWSAHLHRADFEVLAAELSLSDINRYQFRRNRPQSEGLPVRKVGSGD